MSKNTARPTLFRPIITVFRRYHLTVFVVVVVGGLSTAVLTLNAILIQSSKTDGFTSSLDSTDFDQSTIDRINQLKPSDDTSARFTLPSGRTNPFSE